MKKYYVISILIYLLIAVCFSFYMYGITSNMIFAYEDDASSAFTGFSSNNYLYIEDGRYIINGLLHLFVVFVPKILHIHLNDFYNSFGAVFFLTVIQLTSISTILIFILLNKNSKNILLSGIMALNAMGLILIYIINIGVNGIQSCSVYYAYLLAPFFGFSFLYVLYRYILKKENPSPQNKSIILYSILGLCAGCSSEIVAEMVAVTVFLLIFYKVITKKITIKELMKEKTIIIPVLTFYIGLIIMVASPGFWNQVAWRHVESFSQLKETVIPFCKEYLYYVIYKNIAFYIVTILLWLIIIINAYKSCRVKQALNFIVITSFPLIGVLVFYFLLILGGSTFPGSEDKFWVQEPFFILLYYLVFQFTIASNIGYITKEMKNKFIKYIVFLLIPVITLSYFIKHIECFHSNINALYNYRRLVYSCEKIFTYQLYQNKNTIILPVCCDEPNCRIFKDFNYDYPKLFYNLPENLEVIASDDFEKTTGYKIEEIVSEKELQKAKFQKLLDKEFVLNSVENKI